MSETPAISPDLSSCHVVFLHGAGLAPWVWDEVRRTLPLPSTALDVPSNRPGTSPASCAAELLSDPSFPRSGPVVLVLHSLAGVLETSLAMALGSRLRHVVHVATVVPEPGRSFVQARGFPANLILPLLFRMYPKGLAPSPAMILRELGNDLSEAQQAELVARHRPVRPELFLEPVPREEVQVPRTYILCTDDRCVPSRLQSRIANRIGAALRNIDTGHIPMLSRPGEFAELLVQVVKPETAAEL